MLLVGQRCRLPKISVPKPLWQNDVINVVCGSDVSEPVFNARTVCDAIDLEFDGSCTLFIIVRYRRFSYTRANSLLAVSYFDPLLSALIRHKDPYDKVCVHEEPGEEEHAIIDQGSKFQDYDGHLYEVLDIVGSTHVRCWCIYPRRNNPQHGMEKIFDFPSVHELIEQRLHG